MPNIKISLSASSIEDAIRRLKDYKKDIKSNTKEVAVQTAKVLEENIKQGFNGSLYDFIIEEGSVMVDGVGRVPDVTVDSEPTDDGAIVSAHGKEAVFVEFGAGVYFNPGGAPHPARGGEIVAIGEYGHGYGKQKVWKLPDGSLTHGTPASMPMWKGAQEIAKEVPEIAKEVFEKSR